MPSDPMNGDEVFGDGDKLRLTFDVFTSEGGELDDQRAVDGIFAFSTPLGTEYAPLPSLRASARH